MLLRHEEMKALRLRAVDIGQKLSHTLQQETAAEDEPSASKSSGRGPSLLEFRLTELDKRLVELESEFSAFQESNQATVAKEQASAFVETVTDLDKMLAAIEKKLSQSPVDPAQMASEGFSKQEDTLKVSQHVLGVLHPPCHAITFMILTFVVTHSSSSRP